MSGFEPSTPLDRSQSSPILATLFSCTCLPGLHLTISGSLPLSQTCSPQDMSGYEQLVGKANEVALRGLDRSFPRPDPSRANRHHLAPWRSRRPRPRLHDAAAHLDPLAAPHQQRHESFRYVGRFFRAGSGMRRRCGACADVCARGLQSRPQMAISMGSRKECHGDA